MQIAPQSSLPSGGPDSIKNLQPPGTLLLGGENAGQITVTLSAGSKTLAPYWWSETAHAWVAAPNSYQLSATVPTATGTFSKVAEPQFWALLATGGGTVTYCDLDSTTTTSSGEGVPTSRTISAGGALTGGGNLSANRTISLAALDPSPAASFTKGVIKGVDTYGRVVEAEEYPNPDVAANLVFAGPSSGADAPPSFRALVVDDIPAVSGPQTIVCGGSYGTEQAAIVIPPTGAGDPQFTLGYAIMACPDDGKTRTITRFAVRLGAHDSGNITISDSFTVGLKKVPYSVVTSNLSTLSYGTGDGGRAVAAKTDTLSAVITPGSDVYVWATGAPSTLSAGPISWEVTYTIT